MNPGPVEEASKVAQSLFDTLKSTPVILAVLLFNLIYIVTGMWSAAEERKQWKSLVETAMKWCPATKT